MTREQVIGMAGRYWHWWDKINASDDSPFETVWITLKGDCTIHYLEDEYIQMRYIYVRGTDEVEEQAAGIVQKSFDIYSKTEVMRFFRSARNEAESARAVLMIGIIAGNGFAPDLLKAFARAVASPFVDVRRDAIIAMAYASWPELKPLVASVAERDSNEEIRRRASKLLAGL